MTKANDQLRLSIGEQPDFVRLEMSLDEFYNQCGEKLYDLTDGEDFREDVQDAFIYEDVRAITYGLEVYEDWGGTYKETSIWLLDVAKNGDFMGYGLLMQDRERGVPYVGDTVTLAAFQRTGLATRRLTLMNEIAKQRFSQVLHSSRSGMMELEAIKVWEKLSLNGLAQPYETEKGRRFRFLQ